MPEPTWEPGPETPREAAGGAPPQAAEAAGAPLDPAAFLPAAPLEVQGGLQSWGPLGGPGSSEAELADARAAHGNHEVVARVLRARAETLGALRALWGSGRPPAEAFHALARHNDRSLLADALPHMLRARGAVDLEGAAAVLPGVAGMLGEPHPEWLLAALGVCAQLHRAFAGLVADTLACAGGGAAAGAPAGGPHFDARRERCEQLREGFREALRRARGLRAHADARVAAEARALVAALEAG